MKNLITFLLLFAIGFFIGYVILGDSSYIEIRQSYSTGECVAMITYSNEHPNGQLQPCPEVLPKRYNHVWVQ